MGLVGINYSERTKTFTSYIEKSTDDVTKTKFVKFWDCLAYQERTT